MYKIGHTIIRLSTIDSTNKYLANLAKSNEISHGTVVLADQQTEGRGQRGTIWQTEPSKNLLFSLYLEHDDLLIEQQKILVFWAAVSLIETLQKLDLKAQIKWPNDILVNNNKIAGILIENTLNHKNIKNSILGIGLNVNQEIFHEGATTSIKLEKKEDFSIEDISSQLIDNLLVNYDYVEKKHVEYLEELYLKNLWKMNEKVHFTRLNQGDPKSIETGVICGIDAQGRVLIETNNGKQESFFLKEVKFLRY